MVENIIILLIAPVEIATNTPQYIYNILFNIIFVVQNVFLNKLWNEKQHQLSQQTPQGKDVSFNFILKRLTDM